MTRHFLRTKASYVMRARLGSGKKTDPRREESGFLPRRKQKRRSASQ